MHAIPSRGTLKGYSLYHVVRGTFHAELGQKNEVIQHFRRAEKLASRPSERDFLSRRIRECQPRSPVVGSSPRLPSRYSLLSKMKAHRATGFVLGTQPGTAVIPDANIR